MSSKRLVSLALAIGVLLPPLAAAAKPSERERPWYAGRIDVGTGFDFRSGDYGRDEDTDVLVLPVFVRYRFQELGLTDGDEIRLSAGLSYLRIEGPERGGASAPGEVGTDSGLGDLSVQGTYVYDPPSDWLPKAYLSGKLKIPTASESNNLGTGEFDVTTRVTLRHRVRLRDSGLLQTLHPFVTLGYKFVGDPPDREREDAWRAGAGVTLAVTRALSAGLRYSFRESTIPGRSDFHSLSPYVGYRLTPWLRATPYATFGLSERSPDWGGGLALRLSTRIP